MDRKKLLNANDTFRYSPEILSITPKIIYRQTANTIIASMDFNALLVDKTVHVIVPKLGNCDIYLLLGLLNSKLYQYLYSNISQETKGRVFSQVKTVYIKQLPVIEKSNDITILVKEALNKTKSGQDISSIEDSIDKLVYEMFELSKEEIAVVEATIN